MGLILTIGLLGAVPGCGRTEPEWQLPQAELTNRPAAEKLLGRWAGRPEIRSDGGSETLDQADRAALAAARASLVFTPDGTFRSAMELPGGPDEPMESFETTGQWSIVGEQARSVDLSWSTEGDNVEPQPPIVVAVRFDNDETFLLTVPDSPIQTRFIKVR